MRARTVLLSVLLATLVTVQPSNQVDAPGVGARLFAGERDTGIYALTVSSVPRSMPAAVASARDLIPTRDASNDPDQMSTRLRARAAANRLLGYQPGDDVQIRTQVWGSLHGTSSGLTWVIAHVQRRDPQWLAGLNLAGTGVLQRSGHISFVGGLEHKMRSHSLEADHVVLVPAVQAHEAREHLDRRFGQARPLVMGVTHLRDAVGALCVLSYSAHVCPSVSIRAEGTSFSLDAQQLGRRAFGLSGKDRGLCADLRARAQLSVAPGERLRCQRVRNNYGQIHTTVRITGPYALVTPRSAYLGTH
jgi:hypothetical protein